MKVYTTDNIRLIRVSKGFSQEFIAKKLNITQQAYSLMEKNPDIMTLKRLKDLCKILDVNILTLLGEDNVCLQHIYYQKSGNAHTNGR
jgi:transcriptional regulator with XRE-family HTH domain